MILKKFKEAGVITPNLLVVVGGSLWLCVLILYIVTASNVTSSELVEGFQNDPKERAKQVYGWQRDAWWTLVGFHVVELLIVAGEALYFEGKNWIYSTLVIATAICISLYAAILHACMIFGSMYFYIDNLNSKTDHNPWGIVAVQTSGAALILGFLANSAMVAALWSYFHRKVEKVTVNGRYRMLN